MRQVGPFVLGGVLGSGAQGEVRHAIHAPTGTPVAVKLARGLEDRFAVEFETLADLDHPNVVRLWGAGVTDGRRWFAMELARTTLAAAPTGGPCAACSSGCSGR
jgi:serine/threonine protein kinase